MSESSEIRDNITDSEMLSLLTELGAEPIDRGDLFECMTICHHGDSHKLYYYKESKKFMCYTGCGSFDIFGLMMKNKDFIFREAITFIKQRFHISDITEGFGNDTNDLSLITIPDYRFNEIKLTPLSVVDNGVLRAFYPMYYSGWVKEGISIKTMKKFEIGYNLIDNQITIPHRTVNGDLVGIRARNLNKDRIAMGAKYIPVWYNNHSYKYLTGMNLYGLNQNKNDINESKSMIIFEAEKSVLKMDSMYECNNSVALSGSTMTSFQEKVINDSTDVNELIIALDCEYRRPMTIESQAYADKIRNLFGRLTSKYKVSVLWDTKGLLNYKDSPIDQGKEVFEELYRNRIFL